MTKARILADFISDGSSLADGTISVAEVSGAAPLASPTFTGGIDVTGTVVADGNLTLGSSTNAYTLARLDHENVGGKAEIQLNAYGSASFSMLSNFTGSTLDGVATGNFGLITPHNAGISINTSGLERMKIDGSGNTVFNEGGVDADFRVESATTANALFVEGSSGNVGVGMNVPVAPLHVYKNSGLDTTVELLRLDCGDTTHQGGKGGKIRFTDISIYNSTAEIIARREGVSSSSHLEFSLRDTVRLGLFSNGSFTTTPAAAGHAVFNEDGADADFRVESDSNTHMLFVDASTNTVFIGGTTTGQNVIYLDAGRIILDKSTDWNIESGGSANGQHIRFRQSSADVGNISSTSSGTNYNTTSDRRLKDNIQPIADATDKLMAMNPVTHTWKADPEAPAVHGFIAQEMQDIVPEAVSGDPEGEEMMSMDYGRITPVLVAALQDAHKKIEALEARINEMEAK